jgi:opacity protein-like surface antigen
MNTIKLSSVALLLSSTFAFAGGDMAPVQPYVETPAVAVEVEEAPQLTGFYAGLAYSCMQLTKDTPDEEYMGSGMSASVGYNLNPYLAVEARYTTTLGDLAYKTWNVDEDRDADMSNIGIYLKPQFNMGSFGVYGLIGYGQTTFDNGTEYSVDGVQYGAGLSVDATDNVQLFVDYRRLYDDVDFDGLAVDTDVAANSWSLGANYKF